jgi:hypothetical protein
LVPSKLILPEPKVALVAIDHQMVVIRVQVRKNFIEDMFLDGGSRVNIITKNLKVYLGLSKTKTCTL